MSKTKDTARPVIEKIKTSIRTISTCSASTVTELEELLAGSLDPNSQKENIRVKNTKLLSVQSTGRRKGATTTTVAATVTVTKQALTLLSPREKYILATEVANYTLKSLSDALKTQPVRTPAKPPKAVAEDIQPGKTRALGAQNLPYIPKPLQERSTSQATNSPVKPSSLRRSLSYSSCQTSGPDPGLVATAECARIAFAYLRTAEATKVAGKDSPALQLENGLLAFIGKLVAHGLDSLAIKELRILKRRLDIYLAKAHPVPQKASASTRERVTASSKSAETQSLASLLDFGDVDRTSPALGLIITHQTYTLREIARTRRPKLLQEAWDVLKLSNPSSPANLISHAAKPGAADAKYVRQLESLSQTVLSLCPSVSSSDDLPLDQETLQPRPDVVLSLQHLAFKIRQSWWPLAKHQGNIEKELLDPFSKCLLAFARRSRLSPVKKFKVAELLYKDLMGAGCDPISNSQKPPSIATANKCLVSLAQAASLTEDAMRWLGSTDEPDESGSAAQSAISLIRRATLQMDALLEGSANASLDETIRLAMEALSGDLNGASSDLDSLFIEVNALRRTVSKVLSAQLQGPPRHSALFSSQEQSQRMISAIVHFIRRYLGTKPLDDAGARAHKRYEQRITAVSKNAKSIVDSASLCSKSLVIVDSKNHWLMLDSILGDCSGILQHFYELADSGNNVLAELQNPFVRLSNAYWAVHLQLKLANPASTYSIAAMQRSVKLLQARPQVEQQSGLLVMKLERLGEALDFIEKVEDSRNAFLACLHSLIEFGVLQDAVDIAMDYPVSHVFHSEGQVAALGRVLKSYHRSFLRCGLLSQKEEAFFDDSAQTPSGRGLLLEWQFNLYRKALTRTRSWSFDVMLPIHTMAHRLLDLYVPDEFPIRRQRVQIAFFQLLQEQPDMLPLTTLPAKLQLETQGNPAQSQDTRLLKYEMHLKTLRALKTAMRESIPSTMAIRECLSAWQSLLKTSSSWKELLERVDDTDLWLADLQTLVQYLVAKGEEYVSIEVHHLLVGLLELQKNADPSQLVMAISALALQLLHLGYSDKASLVLTKAEGLVSEKSTSTEARLLWHLAYAEYLLEMKEIAKCETTLCLVESLAKDDMQFANLRKPSTTLSGRVRFNGILADACYVISLLSMATGRYKHAARYAKQCVALNRRIWAALESKSNSKKVAVSDSSDVEVEKSSKDDFNPLSSMRNDTGTPIVMSVTHESLDTPDFWSLVPRLYRSMMHHSQVCASHGLLQEAIYMAEQAGKVASSTNAHSLMEHNYSQQAKYWAEAAKLDKADGALGQIDQGIQKVHLSLFHFYSSQAKIYHCRGHYDDELAIYKKAEGLVRNLGAQAVIGAIKTAPYGMDRLTEQMLKINLKEPQAKPQPAVRASRGRKPATKANIAATAGRTTKVVSKTVQVKSTPTPKSSVEDGNLSLRKLHTYVTHRKALAHVGREDVSSALELMQQVQHLEHGLEPDILHLWASYKTILAQGMEEVASDFTFNTLPESTIAFPAVIQQERRISEGALVKREQTIAKTTTKRGKGKKLASPDFITTLHEVRERLSELHRLCARVGSSSDFIKTSSALGGITVLISAVSKEEFRGPLHPLHAAYMSEIPKCRSLQLNQALIEIEQESMSREECLEWPTLEPSAEISSISMSNFQQDFIDIIPDSWTAVSLSLNEARDELYVTRYEADHTPFILRLPMRRHASRDMDEEDFSFDDGKRDFEEIIDLSDFSTRSAKDMTSREARLQWWTEREALDTKLHELLINIENLWLGGFKGIFSQHPHQPPLLARFRKSFENILQRNLPSRRGKAQQSKPTLDARVLELFIGLGDATNNDLDEALLDLLYFVTDIFQFNGEHNAYDEIDFDAMVIETLDALRAYHNASQTVLSATAKHTILILDKDLHAFPWESMPCLQSLSISRLPSLAALRERILAARPSESVHNAQPGHHISAFAGGTSILNPSGDLTHTLKTLKPHLDDLQGPWTHITNRAPTEKEFESALKDKELVLYFGHGSGAQFVRSKYVRRLYNSNKVQEQSGNQNAMDTSECTKPGCATTFLFGCSSVHLTENGDFDPSGMLANYLVAGTPAVVGMLWDVTDKDCDRLAIKAGEVWGLWPESKDEASSIAKSSKTLMKKGKGKGKVAQMVDEVETARAVPGTAKKVRGRRGGVIGQRGWG